jgi:flagellar protein FliS
MFGSMHKGASAYAKVGIETGVAEASPHKLIVMLFDGALLALASAMHHMNASNTEAKGMAISKAIMIIDGGLRASLDQDAGGEIAQSLDALYEYMGNRLLNANLENRPEMIKEVQHLLQDLRGTWEAIDPHADLRQFAQPDVAAPRSMSAPAHHLMYPMPVPMKA